MENLHLLCIPEQHFRVFGDRDHEQFLIVEVNTFHINRVSLEQPLKRDGRTVKNSYLACNAAKPNQIKRLRVIQALNRGPTRRVRLFSFFAEACCPPSRSLLVGLQEIGTFTLAQFKVGALRFTLERFVFGSLVLVEELVDRDEYIDVRNE